MFTIHVMKAVLENNEGANSKKRGYYVGPHVLGDTITMLLNKFEMDFVYYESGDGAYSVEEKKIIKPVLYKSIKKLVKQYTKDVKKGNVAGDLAYSRLKLIIQRGIRLKNYDTFKVENELNAIKSVEELEEYILKLKFK